MSTKSLLRFWLQLCWIYTSIWGDILMMLSHILCDPGLITCHLWASVSSWSLAERLQGACKGELSSSERARGWAQYLGGGRGKELQTSGTQIEGPGPQTGLNLTSLLQHPGYVVPSSWALVSPSANQRQPRLPADWTRLWLSRSSENHLFSPFHLWAAKYGRRKSHHHADWRQHRFIFSNPS